MPLRSSPGSAATDAPGRFDAAPAETSGRQPSHHALNGRQNLLPESRQLAQIPGPAESRTPSTARWQTPTTTSRFRPPSTRFHPASLAGRPAPLSPALDRWVRLSPPFVVWHGTIRCAKPPRSITAAARRSFRATIRSVCSEPPPTPTTALPRSLPPLPPHRRSVADGGPALAHRSFGSGLLRYRNVAAPAGSAESRFDTAGRSWISAPLPHSADTASGGAQRRSRRRPSGAAANATGHGSVQPCVPVSGGWLWAFAAKTGPLGACRHAELLPTGGATLRSLDVAARLALPDVPGASAHVATPPASADDRRPVGWRLP